MWLWWIWARELCDAQVTFWINCAHSAALIVLWQWNPWLCAHKTMNYFTRKSILPHCGVCTTALFDTTVLDRARWTCTCDPGWTLQSWLSWQWRKGGRRSSPVQRRGRIQGLESGATKVRKVCVEAAGLTAEAGSILGPCVQQLQQVNVSWQTV